MTERLSRGHPRAVRRAPRCGRQLEPYRGIILADWLKGEDHYIWGAIRPLDDLLG